jgi:ribonuclease G
MPYNATVGVSQRIEDEAERQRLREVAQEYLESLEAGHPNPNEGMPEDYPYLRTNHGGFILRTASQGLSRELIQADMRFVTRLWQSVQKHLHKDPSSRIVHEELPLVMRTLREIIRTDIERVRIDSASSHQRVKQFVTQFIPDMEPRIEHYTGDRPIFDIYGVEDELARALESRVPLKSGGHLVIEQTEAMTTVDINTGAYVGHRNLEETIFKTNLEAAQAIARQLRLRNLGGIIIIDFIDMCNDDHKRQVLRTLENSLERDNTKTHISEVSSLGLVQMTRKRTRESLEHILCETCPTCAGSGSVYSAETVCYQIFRDIMRESRQFGADKLLVLASRTVVDRLLEEESEQVTNLEQFLDTPIEIQVEPMYTQEQYDVVLM